MDIATLEPRDVWRHFMTICSIPHPSHHEEALANAIVTWARDKGLSTNTDAAHNVVIRKTASPGKERSPGIILQAHLDMVPQAASSLGHDFTKDPIRPRIDPADPSLDHRYRHYAWRRQRHRRRDGSWAYLRTAALCMARLSASLRRTRKMA